MQGIDGINLQARPNIIYVEGAGAAIKIAPEQGKLLNLREGQVINSMIASRPEGNVIMVGPKALVIPPGFGKPGETKSFKVSYFGGGFLITQIMSAERRRPTSGASAALPSPQDRISRILNSGSAFYLHKFFSSDFLDSAVRMGIADAALGKLTRSMPPISSISAELLRNSFEKGGLFAESLLKRGLVPPGLSLKSVILEIRKIFQGQGRDVSVPSGAIDELESYQLDALAARLNRQILWTWIVPFSDASPAYVRISGDAGQEESRERIGKEWVVELDLTLSSSACSFLLVQKEKSLIVSCWIPEQGLYERFDQFRSSLNTDLQGYGIELSAFHVFPHERGTRQDPFVARLPPGMSVDRNV